MGKLTRLEIYNFKSYRGRHALQFGDSYFTSIIGPNGSGKSNSMDAISFVLGVKSSQLRSDKLKDMIYRGRIIRDAHIAADGTATEGGTEQNGAANGHTNGDSQASSQRNDPQNAWVKAVFEDDAEQTHEWQRTITSSGASEYRINGRLVSQKQYNEALEEHSILVKARNFLVFQGDVEKIAMMPPEKLTEQIERISGSLEHKADYDRLKIESEATAEGTSEYLRERRGINGEIKTYTEQKAEADEYEKKIAERDEAIVTKTLWKLFLYQETMEKARNKIASHQEELQEHKRSVEKYNKTLEKERQEEAKIKREASKMERSIKAKEREIEDTTNELVPIEHKIKLATKDREKYEGTIESLQKKRDAEAQTIKKLRKDLETLDKAAKKWENEFKAAAQHQGRELSEQDLDEYGNLRSDVTKRTGRIKAQINSLDREAGTLRDHVNILQQSVEDHEKELERLNANIVKREESQRKLKAETKDLKESRNSKQQELNKHLSARQQLQSQYDEKNQILRAALIDLQAMEGNRQESRKHKEARKAVERLRTRYGSDKVFGRYRDLLSPKQDKFAKAIGRVLGYQMDTVIVDTDATGRDCVSYLKTERLGVMSIVPLDSLQIQAIDPQLKGLHKGMRLAIDCINYDAKYERAMAYACENTMVCDTEKIAKELRYERRIKAKAVTLDGRVISKGGTQTGGEVKGQDDFKEQQFDERAYQKVSDRIAKIHEDLNALPKLDVIDARGSQLKADIQDLDIQINRAEEEIKTLSRNLESDKKDVAYHNSQLRGQRKNYDEQVRQLQNCEAELKKHHDSVNQVTDEVFSDFCQRLGYGSIRDYEAQQGTVQQEAASKRGEFGTQRVKLNFSLGQEESRHVGTKERLEQLEARIKNKVAEISELEAQQEELQNSIDVLTAELETLREERDQLNEQLVERAAAVKEARRALEQRNAKVANVVKEVNEEDAKVKICATNRFNVLKDCRVNEISIPLTAQSRPLTSLPTTDVPDADAMDVDEDPESTMIEPAQVNDYGIEVDFEELDSELRTELLEILENDDDSDSRAQQQAIESLRDAENRLVDRITRLETDISKASPNMRAGERLAAANARLKEVQELWDASKARALAAKQAFEDVRDKRKALFQKAFDHIQKNIGRTYADLTRSPQYTIGGKAYIGLENSEDPYLAGVRFHATPPLKRYRDMEHLSGGEKTIAALALLFAIHSYQPSPFFVLDEVDAALDSINVSRVANYVREHASPGMQFIVISLKASFFQESETLVGVMRDQAQMTSKYLSLDLRKYEPNPQPAAA